MERLTGRTAYLSGLGVALLTALFLLFVLGALGLIGVEGDRADMMYLGVLAVGIIGALIARFRAPGMSRVLFAMAAAQGVVTVIAFALGKHRSPVTSVAELLLLNVMFAGMFIASGMLFRKAQRPPAAELGD